MAGQSLNFLSSKPEAVLRKALGARVWVVTGERRGSRTTYALVGVYTCNDVQRDGDTCVIDGPGAAFQAAITLNDSGWFQELREEQNNFSLGFNPIRSENVIAELERVLSDSGLQTRLFGTQHEQPVNPAAHKLAALLPDPTIRDALLRKFVESMRFVRERRPDWCLVHATPTRLRLLAGRLIVLTLHEHEAWVAVASTAESELATLRSWRWDSESYPKYHRVPSMNGYYDPAKDSGNEWSAIRDGHFAFLDQAVTRGVAPDPRSVPAHDEGIAEHLDAVYSLEERESIDTSSEEPEPGVSFTHAEFFPLLARLILRAAEDSPGDFVAHSALVDLVLGDDADAALVARARANSSWPDDRNAASNMIAWFSQQISVGRSEWVEFFERERVAGAWAYRPAAATTRGAISDSDASAIEGEPRMFLHIRRERNPALVKAKRDAACNAAGQLECEACGFVTQAVYSGCISGELCEVHHRYPLGDLGTATAETRLEDLAVLCPNCHRAIHQTRPMMTVEEFRERLGKR